MSRLKRYEDNKSLIFHLARKFYLRFGGELDEIIAQAIYLFIVASQRYKRRAGAKFSSWVSTRIWGGLIDFHKNRWKHPQPLLEDLITNKIIVEPYYSDRTVRFMTELWDMIGEDARLVVKYVLEPPDQSLKGMLLRRTGKRVERRAIRKYLTHKKGWSHDRVDDSFWDLRKALTSN
jgi:hypothetical protein